MDAATGAGVLAGSPGAGMVSSKGAGLPKTPQAAYRLGWCAFVAGKPGYLPGNFNMLTEEYSREWKRGYEDARRRAGADGGKPLVLHR